jgi:hypothetical protein
MLLVAVKLQLKVVKSMDLGSGTKPAEEPAVETGHCFLVQKEL